MCTERNKIAPRECGWKHGDSGHSAGEKACLRKEQRIDLTPAFSWKAITLKFPRSHTRVHPAHERTHNGEGVAEFFPISATPSNDSGVEKRPQPLWPLLREG